jgi:hypothetical protein
VPRSGAPAPRAVLVAAELTGDPLIARLFPGAEVVILTREELRPATSFAGPVFAFFAGALARRPAGAGRVLGRRSRQSGDERAAHRRLAGRHTALVPLFDRHISTRQVTSRR